MIIKAMTVGPMARTIIAMVLRIPGIAGVPSIQYATGTAIIDASNIAAAAKAMGCAGGARLIAIEPVT